MSRLRSISIVVALTAWVPAAASAQSIPDGYYYKLSTEFRSSNMKLDVFNGGPKNNMTRLEPDQNVTGQFWRITPIDGGWYQLSTQFRGSNVCLDIFNGGSHDNEPHLTGCRNLTGQHWRISGDNHAFRLTTEFRGPDMCLDIFNGGPDDNQPHLVQCGNFTGQAWRLTRTETAVEGFAVNGNPAQEPASGSGGCKPNETYSSSMGQCIPKM
jgi:Ricin-type beta-trefoil lectin domain